MATYAELRGLWNDPTIRNKIEVAITIAAQTILDGDDDADPPWDQTAGQHDIRVKWAAYTLSSTAKAAEDFHKYALAANSTLSVSAIQGASDSAFQNNVNSAIDPIATAQF